MRKKYLLYFVNFLLVFLCCLSLSNSSDQHLQIDQNNNSSTNVSTKSVDDLTLCVKPHLVKISDLEQEILNNEAEEECNTKFVDKYSKSDLDPTKCSIYWDSVLCWPETSVNQTVYQPCANYVNKFNKKNKASKQCYLDPITLKPVWSKTNFNPCLTYEEKDYCNRTSCSMENHINYMVVMRVCGYITSMLSLALSITILLRPKLRCPRNFVHINLFLAFTFRTILAILSDFVTKANPYSQRRMIISHLDNTNDKNMTLCRITVSFFRYSGSIYHMAIFAEAIYLVLLLKFPYYNEQKGSKFCIIISWFLPILWNVPWILLRIFEDNYWCWQSESNYNLILKIPHSLIYTLNVCCAIYIIRILYSKMRNRTLSREKIIKYRRLAKSILIIIPIFGLHFIFFAWIPYLSLFDFDIGPCFEVTMVYIETFFNAFQGLVVSVVCCFIHREVRIEFILYTCHLLKKIKFLQSLKCLNSDYIRQLRYLYTESRGASMAVINNEVINSPIEKQRFSRHSLSNIDEENPMLTSTSPKRTSRIKKRTSSIDGTTMIHEPRKSLTSSPSVFSYKTEPSCCCCNCLFGDQKNDFFAESKSNSRSLKKQNRFLFRLRFKNGKKRSRVPSSASENGDKIVDSNSNTVPNNNETHKLMKLKSIIKNNIDNNCIKLDNDNLSIKNECHNHKNQNFSKSNDNKDLVNSILCESSSECNLNSNKSISFSSDNEIIKAFNVTSQLQDNYDTITYSNNNVKRVSNVSSITTTDQSNILYNSINSNQISSNNNSDCEIVVDNRNLIVCIKDVKNQSEQIKNINNQINSKTEIIS